MSFRRYQRLEDPESAETPRALLLMRRGVQMHRRRDISDEYEELRIGDEVWMVHSSEEGAIHFLLDRLGAGNLRFDEEGSLREIVVPSGRMRLWIGQSGKVVGFFSTMSGRTVQVKGDPRWQKRD